MTNAVLLGGRPWRAHKKALAVAVVSLLSVSTLASERVVTTNESYGTAVSIPVGDVWRVKPGGSIEFTSGNKSSWYIELLTERNSPASSVLILEGGMIKGRALALRGPCSVYRQYSGTADFSMPDGTIPVAGGTIQLFGGTCLGSPDFKCSSGASFEVRGGALVASSVSGTYMGKVDMVIEVTDTYVVRCSFDRATFAIRSAALITTAPKSLTIAGTPVSGCIYALVAGVADEFYDTIEPTVPDGWELVCYDDMLLLMEKGSEHCLDAMTARWTGAAGDGNPRTSGNWICNDASGGLLAGKIPGPEATVYVPDGATDFNFPADRFVPVKELRFLGRSYALADDADWSGLSSDFVTRYPRVIDVNGHSLKLSEALVPTLETVDFTEPGGNASVRFDDQTSAEQDPKKLIDNICGSKSRILSPKDKPHCVIDYDFGEGQRRLVRGLRFYFYKNDGRQPKDIDIYGTMADPAEATDTDWILLDSPRGLNLEASDEWTAYVTFDNETAYRAYRLDILDVKANPQKNGTYLELQELELVKEAQKAVEVTSSVAGGTVRFDIPEGKETVVPADLTLSGDLTVVKEGAGTLDIGPVDWWNGLTLVLAGGAIRGECDDFSPQLHFTAPSALKTVGDFAFGPTAGLSDLGEQTFTIDIAAGSSLSLNQSALSNGVLDVTSGGTLVNNVALDARTVDLKLAAALNLAAPLSVRNYDAGSAADGNAGASALDVYGTFTPRTDYFYGCTLQDGAAIDLSAKAGAWSTTGAASQGLATVAFATGAQVNVLLGGRKVHSGDKLISWTPETRPANLGTLRFVTERGRVLTVREDGVYYQPGLMIILR